MTFCYLLMTNREIIDNFRKAGVLQLNPLSMDPLYGAIAMSKLAHLHVGRPKSTELLPSRSSWDKTTKVNMIITNISSLTFETSLISICFLRSNGIFQQIVEMELTKSLKET